MTVKILHNPRCSKSRQALQILKTQGETPVIIEYLETQLSMAELTNILGKLGMEPRDLLRTGEKLYKELGLSDKSFDGTKILEAMIGNPILIERPIVITDKGARIGRPPESILDIL